MSQTIFFNWTKLYTLKIQEIIKTFKRIPHNSVLAKEYDGNSFILNIDRLWAYKPSVFEALEVIQVASTRNHFNYWLNGYRGAYLDFCGITPDKLKYNRLITINEKDRLVYLKHED
jgi:hypothetical protein